MNGIPTECDNSLMKVKKLNKLRLNSLLLSWNRFMRNGLLISKINHIRRGTSYFEWLERCRDPKCTEKFRNLFGTIGSVCWYWPTSKRAICWTRWRNILQIDKSLIQHLSSEDENIFDVIAQELWFVIFIDFLQSYFQNKLH